MASQTPTNTEKLTSSKLKRVCVYGGTSIGRKDSYKETAVELGRKLVSEQMDLVYGGESTGLIGLVAKTVHEAGRHVLCITLEALRKEETIGELKIVESLHERKRQMAQHADCFIALPGGYEAVDGLTEAISWAQLGIHEKPIGMINVDGYFNNLLAFIDKAIEEGFIKPSQKELIIEGVNVEDLFQKLESYNPVREGALPKELWENIMPLSSVSDTPKEE